MAKKKKKGQVAKKALVVVGGAAVGEAALGIAAAVAAPFTGGATAPVAAALLADSGSKWPWIVGAAAAGAAVGATVDRAQNSGKVEQATRDSYNRASKEYEAKFVAQAREFAEKEAQWARVSSEWTATKEEKDRLLKTCLEYIADLEKEAESLRVENKKLSKEKQELLDQLQAIKKGLSAA